ncbi:hypothetical protein [Anaeroselena agilis]|uniref:Uncharacterized protein n=1 Tax=Anaeroselena agilis TaxID=3063788 RepID=A0ABU3NV98_9FIRM|nr:hypothetical protein [Selenomonadales bacterium 4137-cl]
MDCLHHIKKADMPFESVVLLIVGMTMILTGGLLFPVAAGVFPYYENGPYGLLLVMVSLQMIALGKTPFGDMRRSKALLAAGAAVAAVGILTCCIPVFPRPVFRALLFLIMGPGGLVLLVRMCCAWGTLRTWVRQGGVLRHLVAACTAVYGLSMATAVLIWRQKLLTTPLTAGVILVYGVSVAYLAAVLWLVYREYPGAEKAAKDDGALSTDKATLLLTGIFMLLLGVVLIPVNLGMVPFSGSAQLGLLMVIFAVQMLASGSTPLGPFPRSWLMIFLGLVFAALGIVSCIVPDILAAPLTIMVGVLNILGGIIGLARTLMPRLTGATGPPGDVPPILRRLFATQVVMNLLAVAFGTSMLVANLVPGMIVGVVLAANGGILLYLIRILTVIDKMRGEQPG